MSQGRSRLTIIVDAIIADLVRAQLATLTSGGYPIAALESPLSADDKNTTHYILSGSFTPDEAARLKAAVAKASVRGITHFEDTDEDSHKAADSMRLKPLEPEKR